MCAFSQKAWYDKAFVSVSAVGGAEVELRGKTSAFQVSGGDFDIEGLEVFGGKITRVGTKNDVELSFDGYAVSNQDFDWIFHGLTTNTSTAITTSATTKFRVTALWTNQVGVTSGVQAITGSSEAYRQIYSEAYCTGVEYNMDAGDVLKATLKFKLSYEDETGGQNFKKECKDTTAGTLSATPSYTTTTKY